MRASTEDLVWLSGERFNVDYLFDTSLGRVVRRVVLPERGGVTAGMGRPCGRQFVAVYVGHDPGSIFLQIDAQRFPLDGLTEAKHRGRLHGFRSELVVVRPDMEPVRVRQWTPTRPISRVIDPAYDGLDESVDDFLSDVVDVVESERRREWLSEVKDRTAGPWEFA